MKRLLLLIAVAVAVVGCGKSDPMTEAVMDCNLSKNHASVTDGVLVLKGQHFSLAGMVPGANDGLNIGQLSCVLGELNATDAIVKKIDSSIRINSVDNGRWDDYHALWGYNNDDPLGFYIFITTDAMALRAVVSDTLGIDLN